MSRVRGGIFVIAPIGGDVGERIAALQRRYDPRLAALDQAPHVTLAGSSGMGPIAPDTSREELDATLGAIASESAPITLRFGRPTRFMQTQIVVLPLDPPCPWDLVKDFTQGFAKALAELHPQEFVAVSTKRIRRGRIYIDYLSNSRGATSIANYSLRARKGAPVAVPLRWSELGKLESGAAYDIHSAPQRLNRQRRDPWEGFDNVKQDLKKIMQRSGG